MVKPSRAHAAVAGVALLLCAGPYLVRASGRAQDTAGVANVDLQKVFSESDARRAAEAKVAEFGRVTFQRFEEIASLRYLTRDEITDLFDAANAEAPTEAQKARAAALKAESARRVEEAQSLANKKDAELSEADRRRLRELNTMLQQQPAVLAQMRSIFQRMVNDKEQELMRQALNEVRGVVSQVAKGMNLAQVFDSSSLVYCTLDITPNVLQKVRKRQP